MRLLVAEDNLVNQQVMLTYIENLGYQADVVANGSDALDALARAPYALVLMDCDMPVMDGLTATAEIRRLEGSQRYIPIIAVTANGNRERCLIAGMDDYLAKPLRLQELAATIARWITPTWAKESYSIGDGSMAKSDAHPPGHAYAPQHNEESNHAAKVQPADVFSDEHVCERLAQLRQECGAEMVAGFIEIFIADTSERLARLNSLTVQADSTAVEREAHGLKGSCANLGVEGMAALCQQLEAEAETGSVTNVKDILERLDFEFERLKPFLDTQKI